MARVVTADIRDVILANGLTIKVKIKRRKEWKVRLWLSRQLIRLAALVIWADVEIEVE